MYCYIENYGDKKFYTDTGCVWSEEFNEKLDSFSFVLSNLDTQIEFQEFQYFDVVSETTSFDRLFVLDNYSEKIVNLNGTRKYEYTINLQSEIKILEKFLCPNRQILHSLINTDRTILEVVHDICDLYIPKVKVKNENEETWKYDYFIKYWYIYDIDDYGKQNAIPNQRLEQKCPDLQFTKTSLREILTTLFQVVGYLPVVRNHQLYFMDLRKTPTSFVFTDNRNGEIQRSNSSDSFVSTLRSPLKQTLDENNIVRNEVIGFRDSENVFLRQQENLVLTTDFPIEKIKKLGCRLYANTRVLFSGDPVPYYDNDILNLQATETGMTGTIVSGTIKFYTADNHTLAFSDINNYTKITPTNIQYVGEAQIQSGATSFNMQPYFDTNTSHFTFMFFVLTLTVENNGNTQTKTFSSLIPNGNRFRFQLTDEYYYYSIFLYELDLTPIVKETQVRNQLDVDYTNIPQADISGDMPDLTPLAKSYYTTLEYTYGNNVIKGFSQNWTWFEWYGDQEDTFIDVLQNQIGAFTNYDQNLYSSLAQSVIAKFNEDLLLDQTTNGTVLLWYSTPQQKSIYPATKGNLVKYATCSFNIEYVPFNELTIDSCKDKDLPIEFQNFDTQESSIIMLDNFSARELDKVKRLGNNVLQIQQLCESNFSNIQPLNSLLGESIIFSRAIEFYENPNGISFYNASYVATKDYVMKNFFTALQNKYRAYEYVDKNDSVLRQELHKTYVCVGFDRLINGSDIIRSSTYRFLISTLITNYSPLKYAIVGDHDIFNQISNSYKYDLSVVATDNSIVLSHVEPFANHYGIEISDANLTAELTSLGGYIQKWLPHSTHYKDYHRLGYMSYSFFEESRYTDFSLTLFVPKIELPKPIYEDNFEFYLRDKNATNELENSYSVRYFSNVGERLSDCVQLTYYSLSPYLKISKNFTQYNRLSVNNNYTLYLRQRDNNSLNEEWYESSETIIRNQNAFEFESYNGGIALLIRNLSYYEDYYGVITLHDTNTNKDLDLFNIKLSEGLNDSGNLYLNFSLNDTKTLKVYNITKPVWELDRKVKLNNNARETETI